MKTTSHLQGWLPISLTHKADNPTVDWCRLDTLRFTEPFFEETMHSVMREPFHLLFRHQTPLSTLIDWNAENPEMKPSGFIFHMSRCGSTLISQMLAALKEHIVLSEPLPIDSLLRLDSRGFSDEQRIDYLRGWISAMSQPRNGEQRLFVKLDAWHILDLPLLKRAFPETPWIFLYRHPVEVMASAMNAPGIQFVPGMVEMNVPNITKEQAPLIPRVEYTARVLANILSAALEYLNPHGGIAIDYHSLPHAMMDTILPHFDLQLSDEQLAAMQNVTGVHAKSRTAFKPDSETKRQNASDEILQACATWLDPLYQRLQTHG